MGSRRLLLLYLVLLAASHLLRADPPGPTPDQRSVVLEDGVRIAWREAGTTGPEVVLLHGSPGTGAAMEALSDALPSDWRRYSPDMPGFGGSSRDVPDYSVAAHARWLAMWMEAEGIGPAHMVGHSMGGGVALELWQQHPERVASLTLISAIGVVELELLSSHTLNHAVHGAQLAAITALTELTPHFGLLDTQPLDRPYARNFYDTDQRPLRQILTDLSVPTLIVHGVDDFLVPIAAAREHHRLVPHSVLIELPTDHFAIFRPEEAAPIAGQVVDFITGPHPPADPARVAAAQAPFDPSVVPPLTGPGLAVTGALLALATLVSEDLTCISAGLLVAQGRLSLLAASVSCGLGIFIGDLLLVLAGRTLGRAALEHPPMSWWVSAAAVERASVWYRRNGAQVIFLSRLTPGARLPMYVAAGLLRTPLLAFAAYFALAAAIWTPLLVGVSALVGEQVLAWVEGWWLAAVVVALVVVLRTLTPLLTWRGRRLAVGWWRRQVRWEFWPMWKVYPPVFLAILREMVRHRSLTVFTAANPGMPAGGFIGESKSDIHRRLGGNDSPFLPTTLPLSPGDPDNLAVVESLAARHGWPVVLKPVAGQRGQGVAIVRSSAEAGRWLAGLSVPGLAQEHIPGREYGVFYLRRPGAARGEIVSITDKRPLRVMGDGQSTLERLILADDRAVCMAPLHLRVHAAALMEVPAAGEEVSLVEVGTHSRGALFLDGNDLNTPALTDAIEAISARFEGGFRFGRFDIRVPSAEALRRGESLKVIELNGVTSEPTHIYDPRHGLPTAWRTLALFWREAFAIGAEEAAAGAPVTGAGALLRAWWRFEDPSRAPD